MKEFYLVRITDSWNDIVVIANQQFATYEDAKQYLTTHYDDLEEMNEWEWNDGHDLYEIIRCKEVR